MLLGLVHIQQNSDHALARMIVHTCIRDQVIILITIIGQLVIIRNDSTLSDTE